MDIKLDSDWELTIEDGDLALITGRDAIGQHLKQRYQFILGEWFLNLFKGIPFFSQIYTKIQDPVIIDSIYKRITLDTPRIEKLNDFSIEFDSETRKLLVSGKADTPTGEIDFSEVILTT